MFTRVYLCLLVFTYVYQFACVYFCLTTFIRACLPMFTHIYFVFTYDFSCLPMFTYVYHCLIVLTYVYPCFLVFTCVYLCLPLLTPVELCLTLFTCACLPMFTHVNS